MNLCKQMNDVIAPDSQVNIPLVEKHRSVTEATKYYYLLTN